MSESRTNGGRARSRAFRPALDGRLEDRVLLSCRGQDQKTLGYSRVLAQAPRRAQRLPRSTNRRTWHSMRRHFIRHGCGNGPA